MDDMAEKIAQILNDPKSMEQIKNLSSMFAGSQNSSTQSAQTGASEPVAAPPPAPKEEPNIFNPGNLNLNALGALGGSGISPDMLQTIMKIAPLLSSVTKDDESTRLLFALRPFLSKQRQKKLDESSKMLGLMKVLPLLKDTGILGGK